MRERVVMPLLIPIAAVATIFLVILSGSKILLDLDSAAIATTIAIVLASAILLICTVIAEGPRLPTSVLYMITALPASLLLGVGLFLTARPGIPHEGEGGGGVVAVTQQTIDARDNLFVTKAFNVPIGQEVTVTFNNLGAALHNWHLKNLPGNPDGVKTELIPGGQTQTVKFTVTAAGAFDYVCDVHPEMKGKVTAVEASAAGAAAGGASNAPAVVATDNKFDKRQLNVKAGQEVTLSFENKGQALHNIHIQGVTDVSGKEIKGELIGNGKSEVIKFTIDKPGTYNYICDVHPVEMTGKITVEP